MSHHTLIDAATLRSRRAAGGEFAIIDCRFDLQDINAGRAAFLAGHIPTAQYADLNQDLSSAVTAASGRHPLPDPRVFARRMGELGVGAHIQVIAYDAANASYAARLWWLLRWVGHDAVAVLDGGYAAWLAAGGAIETGSGRAAPVTPLTARPGSVPSVDTANLAAALASGRHLLIDARAAERYAGKIEPIDPVAGHVPGALNHPFGENLDATGKFLAPEELQRRWRARLGSHRPTEVVAMCGSGVTACHNLLSLEVAGLTGAALYPGSWSEWIRDAQRPVRRGESP
jgi:thiosulfate/3-mercaptopyruvate sulfurtransferase